MDGFAWNEFGGMAAYTPTHTKDVSILVVDDDSSIRELLTCLLESEGYRVTQAVDGHDALRVACQIPPSLIISDVMMPMLDGFELVECLQRHPELRTVPVILTTAAITNGRCDVPLISKPFDFDQLIATIGTALMDARVQGSTGFARV